MKAFKLYAVQRVKGQTQTTTKLLKSHVTKRITSHNNSHMRDAKQVRYAPIS
jgi:hypothetical protein